MNLTLHRLLTVLVAALALMCGPVATAAVATPALSQASLDIGDEDADGVPDEADSCSGTQSGYSVDGSGCASYQLDYDSDGYTDDVDQCQFESGQYNGCPNAPDGDGDGVPDNEDPCPGQYGDYGGCPGAPDTDGDGVSDGGDLCAYDPGPVENGGCPLDSDQDGLTDNVDNCPSDAGPMENAGCPHPEVTPPAPTFSDECGTADDTVTVPESAEVAYQVNGQWVGAGNLPATGTTTVSAIANIGYALAPGTGEWTHNYTDEDCPIIEPPVIPPVVLPPLPLLGNLTVLSKLIDRVRVVNREAKQMTFQFADRSVTVPAKSARLLTVKRHRIRWTASWASGVGKRTGVLRVR